MLLAVNQVTVSYRDSDAVLEQLDLSVCKGEFVCIAGRAGCGKTTLLETISGLHKPDHIGIAHADHHGAAGVAVVALREDAHVARDDVARHDHAVARDA